MRLAAAYFPPAVLLKAAAYMCAYCYCLKAHLRQGRKRKDPNDPTAYKDNPKRVSPTALLSFDGTCMHERCRHLLVALCFSGTCVHECVGIRAACVLQTCAVSPMQGEHVQGSRVSKGRSEHQGCAGLAAEAGVAEDMAIT